MSLRRPKFTNKYVINLLKTRYNRNICKIKQLPSYDDQNFYIEDESGGKFVLKVTHLENSSFEILECQNTIMNLLKNKGITSSYPIPTTDGTLTLRNTCFGLRLLNFVEGKLYREVNVLNDKLLKNLGVFIGSIDNYLLEYDNPHVHREFLWSLKNSVDNIKNNLKYIDNPNNRDIVSYYVSEYEDLIKPEIIELLPKSIIHMDLNDMNLILDNKDNVGVIDFDDILYTTTINELAINIAYFMQLPASYVYPLTPIKVASHIVAGYHSVHHISDDEIRVIYPLAIIRICVSVSMSSYRHSKEGDNDHITVCQENSWRLLHYLKDNGITPNNVCKIFRKKIYF